MTSILALDVATTTGWAFGRSGELPQHGTYTLPPGPAPRQVAAFSGWLMALIDRHEPRELVFEAPILPRKANIVTLRKLYGLALIVEMVCDKKQLPCSEVLPQEWRDPFLGQMRPITSGLTTEQRRKALKDAVMRVCRLYKWQPKDDNDADALGIWYFSLCHRDPRFAARDALRPRGAV